MVLCFNREAKRLRVFLFFCYLHLAFGWVFSMDGSWVDMQAGRIDCFGLGIRWMDTCII